MTELDTIIELHKKLIYKIASKFHDIDKEDLFQSGIIGLIKAYNNYNYSETTKFTTYAYNYIFGEMYDFANNMRSIKLNKNILKLYKKIEQAKYLLAQKLGYYPSTTEISSFLGIEETLISEIETATSSIMSLDTETERPIYETIPSLKDSINPSSIDLKDSIKTLTKEEQDIINYRYFKDYTQSETARILGMSQVTVSRYEKKSLSKMYNYLSI
ncbi:MAG: sigma-70 family RNA polymerase sigma factor [Candidatus Coprovivens sp.]